MTQAESTFTSRKNPSVAEPPAAGDIVRQRFDAMKHLAEDLRGRAEDVFRDKPYLVPVTAGAVGFGVGVLVGSKLTRLIALAAIGTFVRDTFGDDVQRIAQGLGENVKRRLDASALTGHEEGDADLGG